MRKVNHSTFALLLTITLTAMLAITLLSPPVVRATGPTSLTPAQLKINNYAVLAGDLTLTFTACDNVNGNTYVMAGNEILLAQNTDSSPHTFSVTSSADNYGRLDTSLTGYSVGVSPAIAIIQMKQSQGWIGAGNLITLACSSNLIKFAVVRYAQ